MSLTLIGPGGAGKTTIGLLLAERLRVPLVDLDRQFEARLGDISDHIDRFGYRAYARENVETYRAFHDPGFHCVAALSSGFMTYPDDVHPEYATLRSAIDESPATFVLIPSLDREACEAETVRRQLGRPFARSAAKEEAAIRERFQLYVALRPRKIETMRPIAAVVDELFAFASKLDSSWPLAAPPYRWSDPPWRRV